MSCAQLEELVAYLRSLQQGRYTGDLAVEIRLQEGGIRRIEIFEKRKMESR